MSPLDEDIAGVTQPEPAADIASVVPLPETPAPRPPTGPAAVSQDVDTLPLDVIGDIPPPPIPPPPPGVAGAPGAATFARPGTAGVRPFRTPAFASPSRGPRFGPGVPVVGGAPNTVQAGDDDLGLSSDEAAELLRRMAGGGM